MSTKIHVLADGSGRPLRIVLTAGQCSDLDGSDRLLPYLKAGVLIADKGYDAHGRVVKPLIDNFFARLKQYRALATRYDKTAVAFLGGIYLAAVVSWIK